MKRTDAHRPGAIIPAHYRYVMSYALSSGERQAIRLDCEMPAYDPDTLKMLEPVKCGTGACCVAKLHRIGSKFAATGGIGKCSVCSALFVYGDVWVHEPTGEHIHIGHECADKYALLVDRSAFELQVGRAKDAAARIVQAKKNAEEREAFLAAHDGLRGALVTKHPIVEDIFKKFIMFRRLSEAQVALVFKLANEAKNPKPAEAHVPAPTGRQTFRGTVLSVKEHGDRYSRWGASWKMTVKVLSDNGVWLAWGTAPTMHRADGSTLFPAKGDELEIAATLELGREAHFAFMKRPRAKLIKAAVEAVPS
jgi:hypothetical protein